MLLASLGACTAMTLRLYARRKQWPLDRIVVELTHQRVHAEDCERCEDPARYLEQIKRRLTLVGALTDDQRRRLGEIAVHCPIHKTLYGKLQILTEIAERGEP